MARDGFFTGLDIGTSSIKVLVAEFIDGSMNVIGVSNVKSSGVKDASLLTLTLQRNQSKQLLNKQKKKLGLLLSK